MNARWERSRPAVGWPVQKPEEMVCGVHWGGESVDKCKDLKDINNIKRIGLLIMDGVKCTMDYYSWSLYLWICLLAEIDLQPQASLTMVIYRMSAETLRDQMPTCPTRGPSASCPSSQTAHNCPFHSLFSTTFSAFLCFLLMISLFKVAPKCRTEVLSLSARSLWCFTGKTSVRGVLFRPEYRAVLC